MENRVTLYIATHNITNKKYFGKTTKYFTEDDLQKYYHGSGTTWKQHLKKYGNNVRMEIYGIYSLDENNKDYVKPIALLFSENNNIAESYTTWLNQKPEDGLEGGNITEEIKKKISNALTGRKNGPPSEKTKAKIANTLKGHKHSSETKKKISEAGKNREVTEQTKEKLRISSTGRIHSEESKLKISKGRTGMKFTDEHKKNLSEAHKGQKVSNETKEKLRKAMTGKKIPAEQVTCPHCGKIGGKPAMKQWHFNNCRFQ